MPEKAPDNAEPVSLWRFKGPDAVCAALILQKIPEFGWKRAMMVARSKGHIRLVQVGEEKNV